MKDFTKSKEMKSHYFSETTKYELHKIAFIDILFSFHFV